jgi:hypothetical protein
MTFEKLAEPRLNGVAVSGLGATVSPGVLGTDAFWSKPGFVGVTARAPDAGPTGSASSVGAFDSAGEVARLDGSLSTVGVLDLLDMMVCLRISKWASTESMVSHCARDVTVRVLAVTGRGRMWEGCERVTERRRLCMHREERLSCAA